MLDTGHDLSLGRTVAREFVGDHHARCDALLLEQLTQQPLGCFGIAAALNQNVEHDAVLIDSAPEPMLSARDADHDLASRAGESHPRALPEPYVTLSRHTAPDVRPFPCRKRQCANRCGLARMTRASQSLAPLGR